MTKNHEPSKNEKGNNFLLCIKNHHKIDGKFSRRRCLRGWIRIRFALRVWIRIRMSGQYQTGTETLVTST